MDIDEIKRAAKRFMPEPWLHEVLRVLSEHDEALTELAELSAYKEAAEKQEPVPADKPARITEQDAMAILLEWDAYRAERSASGVTPAHFKKWLNLAGRALLNKLNAYREQVPAVAVPDGWKLVPAEVDRDTALSMIMAAAKANGLSTEHKPTEQEIENSWKFANAVLAAAPTHSQQSAEPSVLVPDYAKIIRDLAQEFKEAWPDDNGKYAWLIGYSDEFKAAPSHSQQSADTDRLREFADEIKQLCSDFSDRQNRPYMGDVTAAIDGLYEQFNRCPSHESEQGGEV